MRGRELLEGTSVAPKPEAGAAYPVTVLFLSGCSVVPPCQVVFSPPVCDPHAVLLMVAVTGIDASSPSARAPSCLGGSIRLVGNPVRLWLLPLHLRGRTRSPYLGFGVLVPDRQ